jgi:hypothetical protein
MKHDAILKLISVGAANAVTQDYLSSLMGISTREVRRAIWEARKAGEPICSSVDGDSGGYFYPADLSEAVRYARMQMSLIKSANDALNGVRVYIGQCGGA